MKATGPGQSALLLLDVVDVLNKLSVPYAIIGALAASFYGTVRASMDADAIISFPKDKGLPGELEKKGFVITQRKGDLDDPIEGVITVADGFSNRVDLLLGLKGMGADVFSRTIESPFHNSKVKMIGVEDFIAMKVFAGGQKDIEDVKGALQVSAEKIDKTLLKKLTSNYGKNELKTLETLLKECG